MIQRRRAPREAKQINYTPRPRNPAAGCGLVSGAKLGYAPTTRVIPKTPDRRDQAIRDSANGEDCQVRIFGACSGDRATTVWTHANSLAADKGMAVKALDLCGAYCCWACHEVVDGRAPRPLGATAQSVLLDWCMGHLRSLVILRRKGLV